MAKLKHVSKKAIEKTNQEAFIAELRGMIRKKRILGSFYEWVSKIEVDQERRVSVRVHVRSGVSVAAVHIATFYDFVMNLFYRLFGEDSVLRFELVMPGRKR